MGPVNEVMTHFLGKDDLEDTGSVRCCVLYEASNLVVAGGVAMPIATLLAILFLAALVIAVLANEEEAMHARMNPLGVRPQKPFHKKNTPIY